jgi:hypothetical protein
MNRPGAALRRRSAPLNFGHDAPRADTTIIANDDEDDDCRACDGAGVDRFGFDCTTCFGTGKNENDE